MHQCLWCGESRTRAEMRGQSGGTGPVPSICSLCVEGNPGQSWCRTHGESHSLDRFPRHKSGRPQLDCHEAAYQIYEKPETQTCPWCGDPKTNAEMKGAAGTRGKPPPVCYECRTAHPDERWCSFHEVPHPVSEFHRGNEYHLCRLARHEMRYPDRPKISCVACKIERPAGMFDGARIKVLTCRPCNARHPGMKWCRTCADWRQVALFPGGKTRSGARCAPCFSASKHSTTVAEILRIQGADKPECGSCRSIDRLCVDHDHGCCPGDRARSCGKCVLGYLCWRCNTSEGYLGTSGRAFALAEHMQQREKKIAERRSAS